jgi:DNA-directed RNA polymerase subunit RPC12/RpoP
MRKSSRLTIAVVLLFLVSGNAGFGQSKSDRSLDSLNTRIDSLTRQLSKIEWERQLSKQAISILEKTNEQLGLWWNPYGVLIGILGILFAVLAIAATVILFRQSREYRSILAESVANYESIINKFIEEKRIEIDSKIKEAEKELAGTTDKRKELENSLAVLKTTKDILDAQLARGSVTIPGYVGLSGYSGYQGTPRTRVEKTIKCSKCEHEFTFSRSIPGVLLDIANFTMPARCPKCNFENTVSF